MALFPLLYLTLELPKRIINDAIGAESSQVTIAGIEMEQTLFLGLLCVAFLVAVLAHGLLKMRINTMKGVLSERMLRRFRYYLIARILRFPQPYFLRTSQGELVSMVTAEAEPLGGLMGDAIAQPVLQAGQMLTILSFLFFQSVWLGLAAIALIPLQAWLIPKLQRQVNLLNKARIIEVRKLASEIGESAAGASTLRTNGGWHFRMALVTDRLGKLFNIRFQVYKKKFFMKFINNFITQLTPFFFFSIGGYLVIQGSVSLGALVAALAAYKDLSSPWKELLAYYNQVQDMSLRWGAITERFAPEGMVDEALFQGQPEQISHLSGEIVLKNITVRDADGISVLEDVNARFPKGATVAVASKSEESCRAMAELLTRETSPSYGKVMVAGHDLAGLHQGVIAARIGHANSRPFMFDGTIGDNAMMPLRIKPSPDEGESKANETQKERAREAIWAGNSPDQLDADWLDPSLAGLETDQEVQDWMLTLVEGVGSGNKLFRWGLEQKFEEDLHPELARRLVELRPEIAEKITKAGLDGLFYGFDRDRYNPTLPVGANLVYATARQNMTQEILAVQMDIIKLLRELKLEEDMLNLSQDVVEMLHQTFGIDGTDHPLFRKLGIDPKVYEKTIDLAHKSREKGASALQMEELALLLTVPFSISAEQIGPAFSDEMKQRILTLRHSNADILQTRLSDLFVPLDQVTFAPGLTVLENAVFGKISCEAYEKADALIKIVAETLMEAGLKRLVAELIYDVPTGQGGVNLSSLVVERLAFIRAAIKQPDILILDHALASSDIETRRLASIKLREAMPDATIICFEDKFENPERFDVYIELQDGRIKDGETQRAVSADNVASADFAKKLRALETAELFSGLDPRQLRLLAFGARWYTAPAGEFVFHTGDSASDGAYLVVEGEAGLYLPIEGQQDELIAAVEQGRLVGYLSLIQSATRPVNMRAHTDLKALRIGAEEFLAVVENDAATAFKLLQTVASYLTYTTERIRSDKEIEKPD